MDVITVTSLGQNSSSFVSNFTNSIQLSENYEIGLLKIACPPIYNVSEENNKLYIVKNERELVFNIPQDFYPTTHNLAQAIYHVLQPNLIEDSIIDEKDTIDFSASLKYQGSSGSADHSKLILQLNDRKVNFVADENKPGTFSIFWNSELRTLLQELW